MSNQLAPLSGALSTRFGNTKQDNTALSDGVMAGFPTVSFRGRIWRMKIKGESHPMLMADGQPKPSMDFVLVASNANLSKIYYSTKYSEGDDDPPVCWSANGDVPDPASAAKQADTCQLCPHNVWGSKITEQGNKTKACADVRRVAVVPGLHNGDANWAPPAEVIQQWQTGVEAMGGAALLRVPAASLKPLANFAAQLQTWNAPYYACVTRVGFDLDASYPKLTFEPVRFLSDAEADFILALRGDEQTRVVISQVEHVTNLDAGSAAPADVDRPVTAAPMPVPTAAAPPQAEPPQQVPQGVQATAEQAPDAGMPWNAGLGVTTGVGPDPNSGAPTPAPAPTAPPAGGFDVTNSGVVQGTVPGNGASPPAVTGGGLISTTGGVATFAPVVDSAGVSYDPKYHSTSREGTPSYRADGTFRKRRGAGVPPGPAPAPANPAGAGYLPPGNEGETPVGAGPAQPASPPTGATPPGAPAAAAPAVEPTTQGLDDALSNILSGLNT